MPLPIGLSPDVLGSYTEADKLLGYIRDSALDASIDLPARQYVTAGQAAYDCEQVAVTMTAATTGLPVSTVPGGTSLSGACPPGWQLVIELAIVRCCPTPAGDGTPPSAKQLSDHAKIQGVDTHILMDSADRRAQERFGNVTCMISYPPPSGGLAATVARLSVAIST